MVTRFGMSDKLGPLTFGRQEESPFLGRDMSRTKDYSEDTARMIDQEVYETVTKQYAVARQIIESNMDKLKQIAEALLEHEVLDGAEIDMVMEGRAIPRKPRPVSPTYAEKERASKERRTSLFSPKPRPAEG
jgi:cell division protease FtsH